VRPPSGWGRRAPKPANEVITDSGAGKPAIPVIPDLPNPNPDPENPSTWALIELDRALKQLRLGGMAAMLLFASRARAQVWPSKLEN
jgi:hypothetical protein